MTVPETIALELGPAAITRVSQAVLSLMPWLSEARFTVLPNGNLEFTEPDAAEAVRVLRGSVEEILPADIMQALGDRSGLGWNIFFGHVVAWWLPLRRRVGFLRALVNRAELHKVPLRLHWNQNRPVAPKLIEYGNQPMIWGGLMGMVGGLAISRWYPYEAVPALLVLAGGVVLGRIYQRVFRQRICGDALCRAPVHRAKTCPSCGAMTGR
ncbi:MAG: hypothetical protein ACI9U2_003775 [Bradymonadia bacterium]